MPWVLAVEEPDVMLKTAEEFLQKQVEDLFCRQAA